MTSAPGPAPAGEPPAESPPAGIPAEPPPPGRGGLTGAIGGLLGAVRHGLGAPRRALRRRFPWLTMRSRRGKLLAVVMVAGFASVLTVGGVVAVHWTETADFCGRCHTMDPELKAHAISPHRELACAECHVEPGVEGWVRAKLNGTRQLVQLITGTFPTPIPPPGHADLPPTDSTCRRCHDAGALVANGGPIKLVLKTRFDEDEANSKSTVAMVLRPAGFGRDSATRGVHWHIDMDVEYSSTDRRAQEIELITVTDRTGTTTTFVANREVTRADRVQADIDRLVAANPLVRMDCIDCHNRIGHRVPAVNEAIDAAMVSGAVDPSLPYIKREALKTLSGSYPNAAAAEEAIDQIGEFYKAQYPLVASMKPTTVQRAVDQLKLIYTLVATPEMQVHASTYPDNLGHKNYPGCFRCHDGAHFKVVDNQLTKEVITSTCATCHTFPQVGSGTSSFLIGERPETHGDRFWLFNHKNLAATTEGKNSCAACHTQTYCQNCHDSPAINVPHTNMMYTHPEVINRVGIASCTLCHQPTSCERCHPKGVPGLPATPTPTAPPGHSRLTAPDGPELSVLWKRSGA